MENLKHRTKVGLYWSFLNKGGTQTVQFVISIILARLLSPEDFGTVALTTIFITVANVFLDSGFGQALVRKDVVTEKDLSTSFYYSIAVGSFLYICLFCLAPYIAVFYEKTILTPLIRVVALNFLWSPLGTVQSIILKRRLDFKTPARIAIINKLAGGIVGIVCAYCGLGLWSLIIYNLFSSIIGLVQLWFAVKWIPRERFDKNSFKYLWNYGNKLLGTDLIGVVYDNIASFVIGKAYSVVTLGVYSKANSYAMLPTGQISKTLNSVSFPILSKIHNDVDSLAKYYRRMIKVTAFVSFPLMFLLCALAKPLVIILVTEKWESCIILLQILCISKMWCPVLSLNKVAVQVYGRTDLYFRLEIVKRLVFIVMMCFALHFGIVVFCLYQILETVIAMFLNTYYTGKLLGVGIGRQSMDILPGYIISVVMFFIVYGFTLIVSNMWLQIFFGGSIGLAFYILMARLFNLEELSDVKYMLSR